MFFKNSGSKKTEAGASANSATRAQQPAASFNMRHHLNGQAKSFQFHPFAGFG
jgi:hypothetical protein